MVPCRCAGLTFYGEQQIKMSVLYAECLQRQWDKHVGKCNFSENAHEVNIKVNFGYLNEYHTAAHSSPLLWC
jgi:hypothetical protein